MRGAILLVTFALVSCEHLRRQTVVSREASSSSWLSFIIGPLMFIMAFPILWYNERRASINYKRLGDVRKNIRSMSPNEHVPIHTLVHLSGETTTTDQLTDYITGATVRQAMSLKTSVQVKEWRRMGGGEDSPVGLQWVDNNVPSVEQELNDIGNWHVKSDLIYAREVYLGRYLVGVSQLEQCQKQKNIPLNQGHLQRIKSQIGGLSSKNASIKGDYAYFSEGFDQEIQGSLRISLSYCPVGPLTVICQVGQDSVSLQPFDIPERQIQAQHCCVLSEMVRKCFQPMKNVNLVKQERVTAEELINDTVQTNRVYTFIMRVLALLLMVLGILIFLSPISNFLGYIPFVGGFLKGASGFIFLAAAFIISIPLYIIMFSVAWLVFNPRIGIPVLILGVILLAGLITYNNWMLHRYSSMAYPPQYSITHRQFV